MYYAPILVSLVSDLCKRLFLTVFYLLDLPFFRVHIASEVAALCKLTPNFVLNAISGSLIEKRVHETSGLILLR